MIETGVQIDVLGLEERVAGFSSDSANNSPSAGKIIKKVKSIVDIT